MYYSEWVRQLLNRNTSASSQHTRVVSTYSPSHTHTHTQTQTQTYTSIATYMEILLPPAFLVMADPLLLPVGVRVLLPAAVAVDARVVVGVPHRGRDATVTVTILRRPAGRSIS